MKQLDLFDISEAVAVMPPDAAGAPPAGAAIIAFPQARNAGRVRRVAAKLMERDGKARESYWRRSINDLASMLSKAGLDQQQIETQILAFREAVGIEMWRLDGAGAPRQPGGAA
jgi:hypothetical protein